MQVEEEKVIKVYTIQGIKLLPLPLSPSTLVLKTHLIPYIQQQISYSSRIYPYEQPITPYSHLPYFPLTTSLQEAKLFHPKLVFTFNNTQATEDNSYYQSGMFSRQGQKDCLEVILQICQNGIFVHEHYRFPFEYKMGFIKEMWERYGENLYLLYYNTHLSLEYYGKQELIGECFGTFRDKMNRIRIGVDSNSSPMKKHPLQTLKEGQPYLEKYQLIKIKQEQQEQQSYIIDRQCNLDNIIILLEMYYEKQFHTMKNEKDQIIFLEGSKGCKANTLNDPSLTWIKLKNNINFCVPLAFSSNTLYCVSKSALLYSFSLRANKLVRENTHHYLGSCPPTQHVDDHLFYIKDQYLLAYSITINLIKLKYYTLEGNLLHIRIFPWYKNQYGQILFHTFDLLCVRLKNRGSTVRVFFIHEPQQFVEIDNCDQFYSARLAHNTHSDGTGIFVTINNIDGSLHLHSLSKVDLAVVKYGGNLGTMKDVYVATDLNEDINVVVNFGNKTFEVLVLKKGERELKKKWKIESQMGMSNIFLICSDTLCCSFGSSIKMYKWGRDTKWGERIRIPKSSIVIHENNAQMMVVCLEQQVQLKEVQNIFIIKNV